MFCLTSSVLSTFLDPKVSLLMSEKSPKELEDIFGTGDSLEEDISYELSSETLLKLELFKSKL